MDLSQEIIRIDFDPSDFQKKLKAFEDRKEYIIRRCMKKVNAQVKKEWKSAASGKGFKAHKSMPWGDAGYQPNIFSFENNDGTGKIMFARDAFQYRFVEDGFTMRNGQFHPGEHIFKPLAQTVWEEKGSEIMDKQLEKEFEKLERKGLIEVNDND